MGEPGLNLAERHCTAGARLLSADEVAALQERLPNWRIVESRELSKTFLFPDFRDALAFVNRAGAIAETEGHHPDLALAWGRVDVKISSHDAGGLTENDFILASKIDGTYFRS
jgi:4a-hydroxytetrahydrobiopterin dehydratase